MILKLWRLQHLSHPHWPRWRWNKGRKRFCPKRGMYWYRRQVARNQAEQRILDMLTAHPTGEPIAQQQK